MPFQCWVVGRIDYCATRNGSHRLDSRRQPRAVHTQRSTVPASMIFKTGRYARTRQYTRSCRAGRAGGWGAGGIRLAPVWQRPSASKGIPWQALESFKFILRRISASAQPSHRRHSAAGMSARQRGRLWRISWFRHAAASGPHFRAAGRIGPRVRGARVGEGDARVPAPGLCGARATAIAAA